MKGNAVFSHNSDNWKTPSKLYHHFLDHGFFDPCPYKCDTNNLNKYIKQYRVFINPPYSDISRWVDYAIDLSFNHLVFLLIPCRTDTKYFNKLFSYRPYIWFFTGRLHFNDLGVAPFPSCIVVLGSKRFIYENGTIDDFIKMFDENSFNNFSY